MHPGPKPVKLRAFSRGLEKSETCAHYINVAPAEQSVGTGRERVVNGMENTGKGVQILEITEDQAGQRVDNFLLARLKGVPRSHVYRILRRGEVRVNRGRIKPHYRLRAGDRLRLPPVRRREAGTLRPPAALLERLERAILYEDERLLVLDKPAGVAVHGGSGLSFGVIEALRTLRPGAPYLELVHRLDRDTSGCLLVAKRRSALRALHGLLREGRMDKRYLALVRGAWPGGPHRVDVPLRKNVLASGERVVRVSEAGKAAQTEFTARWTGEDVTLVEVRLLTGRTHQIRVHAAHAGHPLAGDERYGDAAFNRALRRAGLRRLFLHAWSVALEMPGGGPHLQVTAPLPADLLAVLERLGCMTCKTDFG